MITRVDVSQLFSKLKNMTCVLDVKARKKRDKFTNIISVADEKYGADDKFEQYEMCIFDRLDSADIVAINDFCKDVVSYVGNVDKLLKTMHRGGVYILYEANSTNPNGYMSDYDIMGYVLTESEAMDWKNSAIPECRTYKWCNMKAVNVDEGK